MITLDVVVRKACRAQIAFRLNDRRDGATIFTSALNDEQSRREQLYLAGRYRMSCKIPPNLLRPGVYFVLAAANNLSGPQYDVIEDALNFEVAAIGSLVSLDSRLGAIAPKLTWALSPVHGSTEARFGLPHGSSNDNVHNSVS